MSKNKLFESLEILDIGSKGQSIAKSKDGIVLMVKNGVPGDIVAVSYTHLTLPTKLEV